MTTREVLTPEEQARSVSIFEWAADNDLLGELTLPDTPHGTAVQLEAIVRGHRDLNPPVR